MDKHTLHDHPDVWRLRTVERHTGHEDEELLNKFFDYLATALWPYVGDNRFVVIGHGHGKADTAA